MRPIDPKTAEFVLIDDDPFSLKLLTHLLTQLGYRRVIACNSGQAALEWVDGNQAVNIIFLDINMPGMDGIEILRRLVELRYSGGVILVSGENSRMLESVEKLVQAQQLVALGHLQKPVRPAQLATLLKELRQNGTQEVDAHPAKRSYTVEQLRAALRGGEIVNFYQPKVALTTGQVNGVECLARWRHPVDGMVPPDQFIELATRHGLIIELTSTVLSSAIHQAKVWSQLGCQMPVAVNITMDDLSLLEFPDHATELAAKAGVEPHLITLEVTERQVMGELSTVLDVLNRLRLKRFRLAIDDFGTGHSSLAQLRDLPFDELKIDRGFVRGAATDETRRAICIASVRMAQQLKMQAVAEGIEDVEDLNLLRYIGCDVGQGYFIARPMPAEDMLNWMVTWKERATTSLLKA